MDSNNIENLKKQNDKTTFIGVTVSIIATIMGLIFGKEESTTGIIILLGIFVFILAFFLISWPINVVIKKLKNIEQNSKKLSDIEKNLNDLRQTINMNKDVAELKAQMSSLKEVLSNKSKRGFIDPRIIVIIIIIILVILLLKQ